MGNGPFHSSSILSITTRLDISHLVVFCEKLLLPHTQHTPITLSEARHYFQNNNLSINVFSPFAFLAFLALILLSFFGFNGGNSSEKTAGALMTFLSSILKPHLNGLFSPLRRARPVTGPRAKRQYSFDFRWNDLCMPLCRLQSATCLVFFFFFGVAVDAAVSAVGGGGLGLRLGLEPLAET